MPSATLLCIGTEITTGQILNTNAQTLGKRLEGLGLPVSAELSVPDDRELILKALDFAASISDLLILTGGLGPTSDDFTRDVVRDWIANGDPAAFPMVFEAEELEKLKVRMRERGFPFAESNRNQFYFPKKAHLFKNPAGSAMGFELKARGKTLWVLPGPPREIEAIWKEGDLDQRLSTLFPGLEKRILFAFQCQGRPEALLAEATEEIFKGSGFALGYRAFRIEDKPIVEVKVWVKESETDKVKPWLEKLRTSLSPWLVREL